MQHHARYHTLARCSPPVAVFSHRRQLRAWWGSGPMRGGGARSLAVYELSFHTGLLLAHYRPSSPGQMAGVQLDPARPFKRTCQNGLSGHATLSRCGQQQDRTITNVLQQKYYGRMCASSTQYVLYVHLAHITSARTHMHSMVYAPGLREKAEGQNKKHQLVVMARSRITHVGPQAPSYLYRIAMYALRLTHFGSNEYAAAQQCDLVDHTPRLSSFLSHSSQLVDIFVLQTH